MVEAQRKILLITAAIVALMVIFPPYEVKNYRGVTLMSGYGFLFDLPIYSSYAGQIPSSIDVKTLFAQIIGAIVVGGLVFLANSNAESKIRLK